MSCRTKTSAAKLTGKMTQKGENVADNSSKSPTTDAECAAGVHSCTIMCEYSENQICNLRLSRTQFLTTQLSANRLPDKLPIGHRKVTNSFLKQSFLQTGIEQ